VTDAADKETRYAVLTGLPVPSGAYWVLEDHHRTGGILIETVHRFKGLEKAVIILWVGETTMTQSNAEVLYVGTSRAKSLLYVVGSKSSSTWAKTM
jgi:superfamily I DNA and/or RNA helicase